MTEILQASLWHSQVGASDLSLAPLDGDKNVDVAVIGLGGAGLSCLTALHQNGLSVLGLDRCAQLGGGAAGRNGGFLIAGLAEFHHDACARFGRDVALSWYQKTLAELSRLQAQHPDLIHRQGSMRLAVSDEEWQDCLQQFEIMRRDQLPVDCIETASHRGLLFPADAAFQPLALCLRESRALRAIGVDLHGGVQVQSFDAHHIQTQTHRVQAKVVVVCIDGGLEQMIPSLQGQVRTARLQMLATEPDSTIAIAMPMYARDGLDYWQQSRNGSIALGGGRDIGGEAEWTTDSSTTNIVQNYLDGVLRNTIKSQAKITHRWAANVAFTESGLPLITQLATSEHAGVWVCGAYNGTGNLISRLAGRELAERISNAGLWD